MNYSADLIPETAAQRSFRTLRDNSEFKEMLFNKSLYQRGKSVRSILSIQNNIEAKTMYYTLIKQHFSQSYRAYNPICEGDM